MHWMTKEERDIVVLAKIESGIHKEEQTCTTRQVNNGRKSTRIHYFFRGRPICRDIFWEQFYTPWKNSTLQTVVSQESMDCRSVPLVMLWAMMMSREWNSSLSIMPTRMPSPCPDNRLGTGRLMLFCCQQVQVQPNSGVCWVQKGIVLNVSVCLFFTYKYFA